MNDNLLGLSHLTFVHAQTIGAPGNAETAAKVERSGNSVTVSRWMMDIPPSPTWKQLGIFDGNVDRCQIVNWNLPLVQCQLTLAVHTRRDGWPQRRPRQRYREV